MERYLGLNVHAASSTLVVLSEAGRRLKRCGTASRRDPPRGVGPGSPSAAPEDPHLFPRKREGYGGEHPNCGWPQHSGLEARLIKLCPSRESNKALAHRGPHGKMVPAPGQRTNGLEDRFAAWIQAGRAFSSRPLPCVEADAGSQDSWRTGEFSAGAGRCRLLVESRPRHRLGTPGTEH